MLQHIIQLVIIRHHPHNNHYSVHLIYLYIITYLFTFVSLGSECIVTKVHSTSVL